MSANPTIYCLQKITDYLQFERLCDDLMACEGYGRIEPLGGFKDKGRDAVQIDDSGRTTVFAYSVRENWRVKLAEDAAKVRDHGHACDTLVFITTAEFTVGERDEAVGFISREFGWKLDLYGVERLRVLLDARYPHTKSNHPQIFPPPLFDLQVQEENSQPRDHVLISYSSEDRVFAGWLTQKLLGEGYRVWCEQFRVLENDYYPEDIDEAIRNHVSIAIAVCSPTSLVDSETLRQWVLAQQESRVSVVPLLVREVGPHQLRHFFASTQTIAFNGSWATGLKDLLMRLRDLDCPQPLYDGRSIAASLFAERDVLQEQSETLFSNCLKVIRVPRVIHRLVPANPVPAAESKKFEFAWAFRRVNDETFLSFWEPPSILRKRHQFRISGGASTSETKYIDHISVSNLTAELIRKSLIVTGHQKGLQYCPRTRQHYFPSKLLHGDRLYFVKPDGTRSYVAVAGQRKHWTPAQPTYYRYSLAPRFFVSRNVFEVAAITVNVGVRITDDNGIPLPSRTANARRKAICRDWWNKEWLNRLLALCQFLSEDGRIAIGPPQSEQLEISSVPFQLESPLGIAEDRVVAIRREDVTLWTPLEDEDLDIDDEEVDGGEDG